MTIEERRAEILRKRLLNQRLANAKFSDYQTPMGGPRRGALRDSTLGVLSDVISNDENDLDNLSFSTVDGVKVNLQNNRAKDSIPTNKIADFSWYHGNYGTDDMIEGGIPVHDLVAQQPDVHPRILAMQELKRKQELERGAVNRENAIYDNPGTDAINSFIEANSAKSNGSLARKIGDGMGDNLAEVMAIGQQLQENHGFDNIEPLADKSLYQIPDHPYGDIHDSNLISDYENYFETIHDEALLGNEDSTYDANGYLQDWRVPLMDDWTGDGEFDYTGAPINPNNLGILGDESAAFDEGFQHPMGPMDDYTESTLDTSYPYVPSDDYYNEFDELTEEEQLAMGELDAALEWRDNNIELAEQLDKEYMERHAESFGDEGADFDADHVYKMGEMDDYTESTLDTSYPYVPSDDGTFPGLEDEIIKEENDLREIHHDLSKIPEGQAAVDAVKETKKKMDSGEINQEEAEEEASNIFSWFSDLFGVDDKSLLRALVKYIGGMLFGLTSGQAAAFAWKGVEADMAREAAIGADAREYEGNMIEFDRQYKAAMKAKNYPLAEQILRKMNDYSGIDKTDPEKYYEGLEYLQDKLADAKKNNVNGSNDELIKGIQAQLDKWIQQGVTSGTKPETWMGSLTMEDADGISVVKQAMQVEGQPLKYWNSKEGKWKLPKEDGYTNAIRTVSSDRSTEFGAMDKREYLPEEKSLNYERIIPNAKFVTNYGVPMFEEATAEVAHSASQAKNSVKSLMQMMDMIKDPRVRLEVFDLTEKFYEDMGKKADEGPIRAMLSTYVSQKGSPIAKIWFNNLGTLITGKLRRETGAAYNKEELVNTLKFFPDASLMPANYLDLPEHERKKYDAGIEARMNAAMLWILTDSEGLQAYPYMEGLMMGDFKPDDLWIQTNNSNRKVIELSYPSLELDEFMQK